MTSSNGAKAYGASGANSSAAVGQTANGNKYAAANGNTYSNTGSGWKGSSSNTPKYNTSSYSPKCPEEQFNSSGWGQQEKSSGSSAFNSGGGGWQSREASARGAESRGGGGGWGGRR